MGSVSSRPSSLEWASSLRGGGSWLSLTGSGLVVVVLPSESVEWSGEILGVAAGFSLRPVEVGGRGLMFVIGGSAISCARLGWNLEIKNDE